MTITPLDTDRFAAIYDEHSPAALGLARRMLADRGSAEDVVQDAFLSLWRSDGYDAGRGALRTYLLTIVRNRAVDFLRRQHARPGERDAVELAAHGEAPDRTDLVAEERAAARVIRAALADLPAAQRQAIELAYFGGLTQSEVAARLGEPLGTVKSRMRIGLERLRVAIEPTGWA